MRNYFVLLVMSLFAMMITSCKDENAYNNNVENFDAGFIFDDDVKQIKHVFNLKNNSNSHINIKSTNKSCNCTQMLLSSKVIPAKGQVDVTLIVNPQKSKGKYQIIGQLQMDGYTEPKIFMVTYTVYPRIQFEESSINFGNVDQKRGNRTNSRTKTLHINTFELTNKNKYGNAKKEDSSPVFNQTELFKFKFLEKPKTEVLENGRLLHKNFEIAISFLGPDKDTTMGFHSTFITANLCNAKEVGLLVSWESEGYFEVLPKILSFSFFKDKNEVKEKKIVIINRDKSPFTINKIVSETVDVQIEKSNELSENKNNLFQYKLICKLDPNRLTSNLSSGVIVLHVNHEYQKIINVNWSAIGNIK